MPCFVQINVGEPSLAIGFGGRGRPAIVEDEITMAAGDHDFHKVSLTPSVTLVKRIVGYNGAADTPISERILEFYDGQAFVAVKDSVFQPSSAARHSAEGAALLKDLLGKFPVIVKYTDGGPDHNVSHWSVIVALLAGFLLSGSDTLVVARTAPTQSWTNPAEHVMSTLNLGLYGVALARDEMDEDFEQKWGLPTA